MTASPFDRTCNNSADRPLAPDLGGTISKGRHAYICNLGPVLPGEDAI